MRNLKTLFRDEESALKKSQVSFPVSADKKLLVTQIVGDFLLFPTITIDLLGSIGSRQLEGIKIPSSTKSSKKGWRLISKW